MLEITHNPRSTSRVITWTFAFCSICKWFTKSICVQLYSFCWWYCFICFKRKLYRIAKSS